MNIDIDRLHMENKGRRDGRTVEMLVRAIQNSSFYDNDVAIVAHTRHWALDLSDLSVNIALSIKYPVERTGRSVLKINQTRYFFLCKSDFRLFRIGRNLVTFFDNTVDEDEIDLPMTWIHTGYATSCY